MNIYIGNLSKDITADELRNVFEVYGEVSSAVVIKDKFTQESRGFGFVEMPSKQEATEAIAGLNGQEAHGRNMIVNEAQPRKDNRNRNSGGYGNRGGGGQRNNFNGRRW